MSFLSTLYDGAGDDETWCFGHQKPGARMDHTFLSASALDDAQALVDGLTLQGQHVWLRSATGGQKASEAQRQYIVSLDVDLAGPGHKGGNNPPDSTPIDEALVALCRRHGLAVNTWTCNDPARLVELAGLGVDGVCTDVPDVALEALGREHAAADPSWPGRR
jgi:glycerophosphoryl diester phosphodiesterase